MKIAVLGPSPVPFAIGGVENLLWGLCEIINQKTIHQAELVKLPSKEHDFWSLVESYYAFYHLDLSHFDAVICTKYPTWMVRHPRLIYYVPHRLRGLYDTYHLTRLPLEVDRDDIYVHSVLDYMEQHPNPQNLDRFFALLFEIKGKADERYFDFPGSFIRKIVRYLDHWAFAKNETHTFFAISETVKRRREYFPDNARVSVIYPPSFLKSYENGAYKHIFTVSRLDGPKRLDMLIEAMHYVKSDIKLYIGGTGPQEKQLKALAANDKRIEFLGFVNDEEVGRYYSESLLIPYFPYDEDYGLITIEAMMHKKPVITTVDAGGPTEFVINGETGFCVKFNAKDIGEKMDYLIKNPDEAKRMGENAYHKVKHITWEHTVQPLLAGLQDPDISFPRSRRKITVMSTYPIYPPQGGGQARIFNLYKYLAKWHDIEIVTFANSDQRPFDGYIADSLREIRVPKSAEHQQKEWSDYESKVGVPVSDIAMLALSGYTPEYGRRLSDSMAASDLTVISHPYLYTEAKKYLNGKRFIYEAQDVESEIKKGILPDTPFAKKLIQALFEVEKVCCENSEFIMTCSREDQEILHKIYDVQMEKMTVVPNGVDCSQTPFTDLATRAANKHRMGLGSEKIGLFMGSWHGPNLEACEKIIAFAPQCPDVQFLLMGSQCLYFAKKKLPANVGLLGVVSEAVKHRVFSVVDFAINPMLSGSGTNLKMFDYMAAGIPIITTVFGARGIDEKDAFLVADIQDMPDVVNSFDMAASEKQATRALETVRNIFDWPIIAGQLNERLSEIENTSLEYKEDAPKPIMLIRYNETE